MTVNQNPEQIARDTIDRKLNESGFAVQDRKHIDWKVSPGIAVRKKIMETCDLHTILRLPTGIFYANGVKANVLFFEAKQASKDPWTKEVWI